MAVWYDRIDDERRAFIERQHVFFVATAPTSVEESVNLSPKGRNLLRVLGPNLVAYLDYPGSGNETAKHTSENGRVTLMFCSFDATAGIVRVYGRGRRLEVDALRWCGIGGRSGTDLHPFVRRAFFIEVDRVQTSCGYAVPRMEYLAERETLDKWCEQKLEPREFVDGLPAGGELVSKA